MLAQIAIVQRDKASFERSLSRAGELYQRGKTSALRARYEKLVDEGRKAGLIETSAPMPVGQADGIGRSTHGLTDVLSACVSASERAGRALALLCDGDPPTRGHLFLFTRCGAGVAEGGAAVVRDVDVAVAPGEERRLGVAEFREADTPAGYSRRWTRSSNGPG